MEILPVYIPIIFCVTLLVAVGIFSRATPDPRSTTLLLAFIVLVQSLLAMRDFYNDPFTMTGKFPLLIAPSLLLIIVTFVLPAGRRWIGRLDLRKLTIVHIIRIPVEFGLLGLYLHHAVPQAMTFEGRNFDLFSGLTAPVVYYFAFVKRTMGRKLLIAWNVICILLLLNVVSTAILSLPDRFVAFGFERPNLAVGYFPFVLLPAVLVPIVLFSHLAAIWKLTRPGAAIG